MEPTSEHRRPNSSTPVKEDLGHLYRLADDTVTRVNHVAELLQAVMAAVAGLQAGTTSTSSGIITLRDLAEGLNQDMSTLQSNVRGVDDYSRSTAKAQGEILASVVETLLEIYDSIQTVSAAIIGLKTTVQEQSTCPWKDLSAESLFEAIEVLGSLAPRIKQVVEDRLVASGRDPETGRRHWWGRVFADRAKEAVVSAFFSVLAGGVIGVWAWVQFVAPAAPSPAQVQASQEAAKVLQHRIEDLESQHIQDMKAIDQLRSEQPHRTSRKVSSGKE